MSLLINDSLLWISIPRCASASIETALKNSNLSISTTLLEKTMRLNKKTQNKTDIHFHFTKKYLIDEFGFHETVCIKRDWFERWMSALEYFFQISNVHQNILKKNWNEIDNNFIYEHFNSELVNALYSDNEIKTSELYKKFFTKINKDLPGTLRIFCSENFWKDCEPCTYEFNINELNKFENFIYEKYNVNIQIKKTNETKKIKNKIIINDNLKNFIWENFENQCYKIKQLI